MSLYPKRLQPNWPFDSAEDRAEFDALQENGYSILRQAHALFEIALRNTKAKDQPKPAP